MKATVSQVDGEAGSNGRVEHRVRLAELFDAEVRPHNERFRAATSVGPHDRVLDIGCGTGQSTREAAKAAVAGSVLGVDVSAQALDLARRLGQEEGLRNISFLQADAQVHRFEPSWFDLCISRFGVMFFADPVAAFGNIGLAVRPGGRLVLLVWQGREQNEWAVTFREALAPGRDVPVPPELDPFSLADPVAVEAILTAAGFDDIGLTDVSEPVYYGPDTDTAYDLVLGLREPKAMLADLSAEQADLALGRLRAALAAHHTGSGVYFDSRAWIITAPRKGADR